MVLCDLCEFLCVLCGKTYLESLCTLDKFNRKGRKGIRRGHKVGQSFPAHCSRLKFTAHSSRFTHSIFHVSNTNDPSLLVQLPSQLKPFSEMS